MYFKFFTKYTCNKNILNEDLINYYNRKGCK